MKEIYLINARIIDPLYNKDEIGGLIIDSKGLIKAVGEEVSNANLPSGETIDDLIELVKKYNCCGIIAACVSPEIVELSIPKLNKQKLHFGFKMNLFRELPTSSKDNFHHKGFDGDAEYENPADLLGTRKDEFLDKKFKNFILNTINKGTTLIGGCCEVKPRHINLLKDIF